MSKICRTLAYILSSKILEKNIELEIIERFNVVLYSC